MRGDYYYTRDEGEAWLKLPIPPIPTKKMKKICRVKRNWGSINLTNKNIPITVINAGYWGGTDYDPTIYAYAIKFPNGRIWNSHFRSFIDAVIIFRAQTLDDLLTISSFSRKVKNFFMAPPKIVNIPQND